MAAIAPAPQVTLVCAMSAATKIVALLLGPASLAVLATLQQPRQTAVTAATCNGQTPLVQGASAFEGIARRECLWTVAPIFAAATTLTAAALALAPAAIALGRSLPIEAAPLVRWLAAAVPLSSLFVFLNGTLNALGRHPLRSRSCRSRASPPWLRWRGRPRTVSRSPPCSRFPPLPPSPAHASP